jgi:hypothetical protein
VNEPWGVQRVGLEILASDSDVATITVMISEEKRHYLFRHMLEHMVVSGDESERQAAIGFLHNLNFLTQKLVLLDIANLISDYELLPEEPDLELIKDALRLSQHILEQDKTQLKAQLYGRLFSHKGPEAKAVLDKIF